MNNHKQKMTSLQPLLGALPSPPPPSPRARLRKVMRMVKVDPIVKKLLQRRDGWMNRKLSRLVAETIAVEAQGAPELGRKLCHWVLRPKGNRPGTRRGPLIGKSLCDKIYDAALQALDTAEKTGSRRALRLLSHLDEEFEAEGITLPHGVTRSSPAERLSAVLNEPTVGEDIFDVRPEDFLFDMMAGHWYQQDARGEWMGPYTDTGFTMRLLKLGLPRNKQDGFKSYVPQYDRAEPLFDTEAEFEMRHGAGVRNTYVKPVLVPEPGAWFNIYRVLLNLVRGNIEHLDFLLDWIAAPLQSLRNGKPLKMRTAIVLHGDEGAGKGTLERILKCLYGPWNVAVMGQNALESRFHEQLVDKLFVVANEVISSTNRSAETQNLLKPWVTDDEIPMEAKHKAGTKVTNRFNILFTSNDEKPVIVPKKDRRYTVFKTGPRLPQRLSDAVYADLDGPQHQLAGFYWNLLCRKVRVKVGQVLDTEARREVQAATASSDEKFVAALKQEGWYALSAPWVEAQRPKHSEDTSFNQAEVETNDGKGVLSSRLNEVYQDFCRRQNLKPRDPTQLGKTLKDEVPGAWAKEKKLGGVPRRIWFGLPMLPPTMEADVIPLPTAATGQAGLQAPVLAVEAQPAVPAVDDGDFGTGAA